MGFFSWHTQDTNRSIDNSYSLRDTFPVTMIDDKGNKYFEPNYNGYGVFGGKDFYILLAEMNGMDYGDDGEKRNFGLDLASDINNNHKYPNGENPTIKYPNLVELPDHWTYIPNPPVNCKYQGYFYDDEWIEEEYDDYDWTEEDVDCWIDEEVDDE